MSNAPQEAVKKEKFSDRLISFIQKRRIALIAIVVVVFAGIAVTGGVYFYIEVTEKKAASLVEALAGRYDEIRAVADDAKKDEKIAALVEDLKKPASQRDYPAARALSLLASISADKKNWAEAEKYWLDAAKASPKSYLAPIAVYNAATAAEERGDSKKALELYNRCAAEYKDAFPLAPRAMFATGRINEDLKDFAAANTAYKKIIDTWPNDSWTKLAHSRIISIAAKEGSK